MWRVDRQVAGEPLRMPPPWSMEEAVKRGRL